MLAEDLPVIELWYQSGTAGYSSEGSDVALDAFNIPVFTDIKVSG
ncbi:hypothetical protein [Streptomyces sp. NPDC094147]